MWSTKLPFSFFFFSCKRSPSFRLHWSCKILCLSFPFLKCFCSLFIGLKKRYIYAYILTYIFFFFFFKETKGKILRSIRHSAAESKRWPKWKCFSSILSSKLYTRISDELRKNREENQLSVTPIIQVWISKRRSCRGSLRLNKSKIVFFLRGKSFLHFCSLLNSIKKQKRNTIHRKGNFF